MIGVPGQTNNSYKAALKVLEKYRTQLPLQEIVTHAFPLDETSQAMDKAISEDDEKRHESEVQKVTDQFIGEIDSALSLKEIEIMQV